MGRLLHVCVRQLAVSFDGGLELASVCFAGRRVVHDASTLVDEQLPLWRQLPAASCCPSGSLADESAIAVGFCLARGLHFRKPFPLLNEIKKS